MMETSVLRYCSDPLPPSPQSLHSPRFQTGERTPQPSMLLRFMNSNSVVEKLYKCLMKVLYSAALFTWWRSCSSRVKGLLLNSNNGSGRTGLALAHPILDHLNCKSMTYTLALKIYASDSHPVRLVCHACVRFQKSVCTAGINIPLDNMGKGSGN